MNGQQAAAAHAQKFAAWVTSKTDSDFKEMANRGHLNRGEICRECGFARSVLVQNPRVKDMLRGLEDRLREVGVLPRKAPSTATLPLRPKGQLKELADADRLKRLEAENAGLRVEIADMRQRLQRYDARDALLAETGRYAR
jgi:hypothetical protein